jgi:AcrR family transcriptional regulator
MKHDCYVTPPYQSDGRSCNSGVTVLGVATPSTARSEQKSATRRRIVEATVELHSTIGPARTTISAIADRAGVPRLTVYRHFPDQRELELACSALIMEREPLPDPAAWTGDAPSERLCQGLDELYRYYAGNEGLLANVLRDAEVLPTTHEMVALRLTPGLARIRDALVADLPVVEDRRRELMAAVELATDFATWRLLVRRRRLGRRRAAELMTRLVLAAGTGPG